MHFQVKIILKSNHNNTPNFNGHKVGVSIKMMIKMILIQTKKNIKKSIQIKKKMHINSLI
jgi:hypothetical protein